MEERERDKRITGAGGSVMNPRGGTVHHNGENLKFVRFTTSWRGRCAPEVEGGQHAFILCGSQGERGGEGGYRR
jgi:hypothetical protein